MKGKKEKGTAAWILEFAGQKRSGYVASVLLAAAGAAFQMLPYLVMAHVIQRLLGGDRSFAGYAADCLIMAGMWLLRVVLHALSTSASHVATFAVLGNIRRQGLARLERMPLGDVQKRGSGELKNILVERIDSIETTLAHVIPEVTGNVCVVAATIVCLLAIDWRMALVSLITLPVGFVCFMLMMVGYEENYGRTVRATKNLNDTAVEYIGGIEVIKVFGKAKSSYEKFVAAAREGAASYVDWMRKCNVYFTFAMNIMPATLVTVLPVGALLVRGGSLAVPDFVMIVILAMGLITPIIGCMSYNDDLAKLRTVLGEVVSIIGAEELPRPERDEAAPQGCDVRLNDVRFSYGEKEVLHGVDLTFREGTVNALVGPSGSGKSTIARLIASWWDVDSGSITIGGADIRRLSPEHYHRLVAYVSQDNFLFDTTIRENIRMGDLTATDAQVEQAARDCGCYEFIMSLEHGFDTVAGSGGGHLSGGERQRISIARAMLKNAPVIILDEATAYTDPENEALIQQSVAKLVKGRTLIVIAHRLSTVTDADQIVVVNGGRVEAAGTHEQLLEGCALYGRLWNAHISSRDSLTGGASDA
ncbi:MAG: ABC transporter ATP-binding protein [Aristaeellaceae bacterium]